MGFVEKTYGVNVSSSWLVKQRELNLASLSEAFKPYLESILERKVRRVIAYYETTRNIGFCSTCSFEEIVVEVYFKSNEGKLCKYVITASLSEVIQHLMRVNQIKL